MRSIDEEINDVVGIVDQYIIPAIKKLIEDKFDELKDNLLTGTTLLKEHDEAIRRINERIDIINKTKVEYFDKKLKEKN